MAFGIFTLKKLHIDIATPVMVIPGGQAIGVLISKKGVIVVGHLPLKGADLKMHYPAKEAGLEVGDILLAINNIPVNRVDEVEYLLAKYASADSVLELTIKRNQKLKSLKIKPVLCPKTEDHERKSYLLGIFIEDPAAGIGTLTFYDPVTLSFAGLGHRITVFAGKKEIPFEKGEIVLAQIKGIKIGVPGQPGEKIGIFRSDTHLIGQIEKNTRFGVFGKLSGNLTNSEATSLPIAYNSQVHIGPASILTVIQGNKVEKFQVEIVKVFRQDYPRDKGMIIRVTDPLLLKTAGGIIQGMSGSPIIQDGRLVGAITHVFVNDPAKGYGILAEWMIQAMQERSDETRRAS
jgi:stage IV sporulation protein B